MIGDDLVSSKRGLTKEETKKVGILSLIAVFCGGCLPLCFNAYMKNKNIVNMFLVVVLLSAIFVAIRYASKLQKEINNRRSRSEQFEHKTEQKKFPQKPHKQVVKVFVKKIEPVNPEPSSQDFFRYGGVNAELLTIDLMDGLQFEYWCAEMLKNLGFTDINVTPASGDHGVDILACKEFIRYAIQCKRYKTDLGSGPVQEVHAGKSVYHCHVGVVITNQHFTDGAKTLANATDVLLWDRDFLKKYLESIEPKNQ